jgi:hypothetical protein
VTTFILLVGMFKSGLIDFRLSVFAKKNFGNFYSLIILSSIFLVSIYGLEVVMAHALTYFIYLLVLVVYFRKSLF